MANPQIDILTVPLALQHVSRETKRGIEIAKLFNESMHVKAVRLWPEQFREIQKALRENGHRADGFKIGRLKAVIYDERN